MAVGELRDHAMPVVGSGATQNSLHLHITGGLVPLVGRAPTSAGLQGKLKKSIRKSTCLSPLHTCRPWLTQMCCLFSTLIAKQVPLVQTLSLRLSPEAVSAKHSPDGDCTTSPAFHPCIYHPQLVLGLTRFSSSLPTADLPESLLLVQTKIKEREYYIFGPITNQSYLFMYRRSGPWRVDDAAGQNGRKSAGGGQRRPRPRVAATQCRPHPVHRPGRARAHPQVQPPQSF